MLQIESINIKNFKNLDDVTINPAKLNLLFGANASGKSSIMKAIYFLFQNYDNFGDLKMKFDNGLNLDSFESLVGKEKKLEFNFKLKQEFLFLKKDLFYTSKYLIKLISLSRKRIDSRNQIEINNQHFLKTLLSTNKVEYIFKAHKSKSALPNRKSGFEEYLETVSVNVNLKITFFIDCDGKYKKEIEFLDLSNNNSLFMSHSLEEKYDLNVNWDESGFYKKINNSIYSDFSANLLTHKNINWLNTFFRFGYLSDLELPTFYYIYNLYTELPKSKRLKNTLDKFLSQYYSFSVFVYFLYYKLSSSLKDIKSNIFYCTSVRELPLKHYDISNGGFNKTDYSGLLEEFYSVQMNFQDLLKNDYIERTKLSEKLVEDDWFKIYDKIPPNIYSFEHNNLKNIYNFILNFTIDKNPLIPKLNIFAFIHKSLFKLGFNKIIYVEKNADIGKILTYDIGTCKILNFINESSGLQQIFPVILSYHLSQFMLTEQPELHLHPALQSKLALVFTEPSLNNYNTWNRQKQFDHLNIIETHSEHLVRKLQVLVAQGKVDKNDLNVLFCSNENNSCTVEKIEIEDNGFLSKPWPDGFFDESYNLTKELLFGKEER